MYLLEYKFEPAVGCAYIHTHARAHTGRKAGTNGKEIYHWLICLWRGFIVVCMCVCVCVCVCVLFNKHNYISILVELCIAVCVFLCSVHDVCSCDPVF